MAHHSHPQHPAGPSQSPPSAYVPPPPRFGEYPVKLGDFQTKSFITRSVAIILQTLGLLHKYCEHYEKCLELFSSLRRHLNNVKGEIVLIII